MKKAFALIGFFALSGGAFAAELPQYDIKASCHEIAEIGAGGSTVIERQCRQDEADALRRLKQMDIPTKTLRGCDEIASAGGGESYVILEQCIKDELDAAADL